MRDRENRFSSATTAPVKEGDELDLKIEAIGDKGDGIAKKNGFVIVVPGTQINDEVRVRVTKVLKRVGFAEVIGKAGKKSEDDNTESEEESGEEMQEESSDDEESESMDEEETEDSEDFGEEDR